MCWSVLRLRIVDDDDLLEAPSLVGLSLLLLTVDIIAA
jgi:hypothetical protein